MSFYGDAGLQNLELCILKIIKNNYVTLKKQDLLFPLNISQVSFTCLKLILGLTSLVIIITL